MTSPGRRSSLRAWLLMGLVAGSLLAPIGARAADVAIPHVSAARGTSASVPVSLAGLAGQKVVAAEVFLSLDSSLLTFSGVDTIGALAAGWLVDYNLIHHAGQTDTLKIAAATAVDTVRTDGVLLRVSFAVADRRTPRTSALILWHVLLNDGAPAAAPVHGSVTVTGVDGSLSNVPATLIPAQTIPLVVTDADEDRTAGRDTARVRVASGAQAEGVALVETGAATGVFSGSVSTVFSMAYTSGDGLVQARAGDLISLCYDDSLDALGATSPRCHSVQVLGGVDGQVAATVVLQPGDTLYVRVTDPDLNPRSDLADTASVVVADTATGETATVLLRETGVDTDVFLGRAYTVWGAGAGSPGDTVLSVKRVDSLYVKYSDLDVFGGRTLRRAVCSVVNPLGDASGNGELHGYDAALVLEHVLGTRTLQGLDSLAANLDALAPNSPISSLDASLILQKRVGLIDRFPLQGRTADNHPQPETGAASPRLATDERRLQLVAREGYLALVAEEREGILAGDLLVRGFAGRVHAGEGMPDLLLAARRLEDATRVVFASVQAGHGPGELLRLFPDQAGQPARLGPASFNEGSILGRSEEDQPAVLPVRSMLRGNAPNPFNPETLIRYELAQAAAVRLEVYNAAGQKVRTLVQETQVAGAHEVIWDGRDGQGASLAGGVYLCRLQTPQYRAVHKMILAK